MKVWIDKDELEWFKEMQDEGRTRGITITTFPNKINDIELEIKSVDIVCSCDSLFHDEDCDYYNKESSKGDE